jgi:hypothetical protein
MTKPCDRRLHEGGGRAASLDSAGSRSAGNARAALIYVAYDTMARRSEMMVAFDFRFPTDGTGRVLIRRSKTDQVGEGNTRIYGAPRGGTSSCRSTWPRLAREPYSDG